MAASNGFDEALVIPALTKRKGWKQPTVTTNPPFPTLTGDVITCLSGLYFNSDHSACSPVLLWNCQEDELISPANFNQYLLDLQSAVIMSALNGIFIMPQIIESPKSIFSKNFQTPLKAIPNIGNFCGWQLNVAEGDYAVKIDSIALLMSKACNVTLYLYNDMVQAPLWTKSISVPVAASQYVVNIDDLILHYSDDTHKTGIFYFGYYQDELAAQGATSLDVYLDLFNTYNIVAYQGFQAVSDYAAKTFVRQQYTSNYRTYGLNLEISTYNDFTNTIVRNASQFDRLLGMCMVEKCISEVMSSGRSNSGQRVSEQQLEILYRTLEGTAGFSNTSRAFDVNVPYKTGLRNKIEREMYRMTQTFLPDDKIMVTIPPVNNGDSGKGYNQNVLDISNNWGHQI